jgi:hypothetical protein
LVRGGFGLVLGMLAGCRTAPGGELVDLRGSAIQARGHLIVPIVPAWLARSTMLRPTRSRSVTRPRYRRCIPPVQPDQKKISSCIDFRHSPRLHAGRHPLASQRRSHRQVAAARALWHECYRPVPRLYSPLEHGAENCRQIAPFWASMRGCLPRPARLCRTQLRTRGGEKATPFH